MNSETTTPMTEQVVRHVLAMPIAQAMQLRFRRTDPGEVELEMPVLPAWCFAPGQLHATALFAIADFAAVGAAGTMLPMGWRNSTIDATVKLLSPARGDRILARGRVIRAGRTLTVCAADVYAIDDSRETLCATFLGSARNVEPKTGPMNDGDRRATQPA